ncbi:hypothetical protein [Demequina capsici]|uniref:Uncharacterized protein n=1 Tax=Demequina capsici TaxID=3075620 RepID=A0AA96F6N0_9MICO|nr:hypothetical protein [Demequina sp. OYTSA14]WNM23762.1 hypothetical protein RN606_10365 [Demequina sp. OYTSA14]
MRAQQVHTDEWARFGPWIDPVKTMDEVPPLYRDHPLDLMHARLVLKVPRDIEHRDATPDMDLYDHLVVIDELGVTVLTRNGAGEERRRMPAPPRGYRTDRVDFDDLVAVHDSVNLLHGLVTLRARDGRAISMRHSGSPRGGVGRLIDALREELELREPGPWGQTLLDATVGAAPDLGVLSKRGDIGIAAALRDLRAEHRDVTAWACHGHRRVRPAGDGLSGMWERARQVLSPVTLQGGVLAGDRRVIELLGRHEWLTRGSVPTLSSSRLTVPMASIDGVDVEPHHEYPDAVVLTLRAGDARMPFAVPVHAPMVALLAGGATSG